MLLSYYLKSLIIPKKRLKLENMSKIIYFRYLRHTSSKKLVSFSLSISRLNNNITKLNLLYTPLVAQGSALELNLNNLWFHMYKQLYFSDLLKLDVELRNMNFQQIIPPTTLSYMMYAMKAVKWKKYYITHSNEVVEVLFLCLWLKNLKMFMDWMRRHFEKTNLKKHKKLFLLLNFLLGKLIWNYNIFLRLKGLRVVLRGKFGKAGSVRKTRKYIRRGKCSYTSKNIALINQTNVIRTLTGVFSIKMEVFF